MRGWMLAGVLVFGFSLAGMAQTQLEMNEEAQIGAAKADAKLNQVYQELLKLYAKNPEFTKQLRVAQRLWVQLRDAQRALKFPDKPHGYYGSVSPMCVSLYMTELTNARTKELQQWLSYPEGAVCAGSIGTFDEVSSPQ